MKKKVSILALVLVCVIAVGSIAYIVFHKNCGTAHWARHVHVGMSYDRVVELLGQPRWLSSARTRARFDLDNGQSLIVTFYQDDSGEDTASVHACYFDDEPNNHPWLIGGIALGVCLLGGGTAFCVIKRKKKAVT